MKLFNLSGDSRSQKIIQFFMGIFIITITLCIFQIFADIITYLIFGKTTSELNIQPNFDFFHARLTVSTLILATWIICKIEKTDFPFYQFQINDFVFACLIGALVIGLPEFLYSLIFADPKDYHINYGYNFNSIPFRIIAILLAVIGEELVFRYFLVDKLKAISRNKLFLIIASSLIFSGFHTHLDLLQMVALFFKSILYGYAYIFLNSISLAIGLHFIHNLFAVLIFGYDVNSVIVDNYSVNEPVILVLLLIQSLILLLIIKKKEAVTLFIKNQSKVFQNVPLNDQ